MAPPALKHVQHSPFLRHQLPGWTPNVPHIRYPATFGLYQEGDNMGLFLAPTDLRTVGRALDILDHDTAIVLEGAQVLHDAFLQAPEPTRVIPWTEIGHLEGEVDIVHVPAGQRIDVNELLVPTPALACPEQAVPTEHGSRVTLGLNDSCHVVVISPETDIIQRALRGFIEDYVRCASLWSGPLPELPDSLIEALAAPMAPGAWHELMLHVHPRYWTLDIHPSGEETAPIRWVSEGPSGHWRGGWAW